MTANTDIVTLGALVTVDATRAVRICASGNPRIERGELLQSGRVTRIYDGGFELLTEGLGRLNTLIFEWSDVLDVWEHQN